jgi:hypothetical protein
MHHVKTEMRLQRLIVRVVVQQLQALFNALRGDQA